MFGGLGTNNQQSQPQTGGLFGGLGQSTQTQPQQQQTGGLFGLGQSTQQNQPQQQTGGLFGLNQNNQQQAGGLFNNSTQQGGLFQNSVQQQPLAQSQQGQLGSSLWQPNSGLNPRMSVKLFTGPRLTLRKVKKVSQIRWQVLWSSGILATRTALSDTTSTTKSATTQHLYTDPALTKIRRSGRRLFQRSQVLDSFQCSAPDLLRWVRE